MQLDPRNSSLRVPPRQAAPSTSTFVAMRQVVADEVRGHRVARLDATDFGGGQEHVLRTVRCEKFVHGLLVTRDQLVARGQEQVVVTQRATTAHDGGGRRDLGFLALKMRLFLSTRAIPRRRRRGSASRATSASRRARVTSAATISSTRSSKLIVGVHDSSRCARDASPRRVSAIRN